MPQYSLSSWLKKGKLSRKRRRLIEDDSESESSEGGELRRKEDELERKKRRMEALENPEVHILFLIRR